VQSTALLPLSIQDLIVELVKICDTNIVKLASYNTCMCVNQRSYYFYLNSNVA